MLNGKIAYITGGSKGIGYGVAEKLLEQGCTVYITARSQSGLDQAIKTLSKTYPGKIKGMVCLLDDT